MKPQPAVKSYFFGKGYRDLFKTMKDSWKMNLSSAADYWGKTQDCWHESHLSKFLCVVTVFSALSIVVFGTLWFVALSLVHTVILGLFFLPIYLSFSFLWCVERAHMLFRGIFTACPRCHHKSDLPHYLCPQCKVVHTRLIPSSYGILKRVCNCGYELPCFFPQRRTRLKDYARCPNSDCHHMLRTEEATPICIPIVGGPSVGKTCYLFSATYDFLKHVAPRKNWKTRFLNTQNEKLYERVLEDFKKGIVPAKTVELNPTAFNFFITSTKWSPEKLIYFYDAAGEAFQSDDNLLTHRFYGYLHGFLFIIDPFSIPAIFDKYRDSTKLYDSGIKPSEMMLEDAFNTMIRNLEKNHKIRSDEQIDKPCAVVINKVDAFDLEEVVGREGAKKRMINDPSIKDISEAVDSLCKELFTNQWGLGNFLRLMDSRFRTYRFFTCSALGRSPNSSAKPFRPYRVREPLEWLLAEADRNLGRDLQKNKKF